MSVHFDLPGYIVGNGAEELFLGWWLVIEIEVTVLPLICRRDLSSYDEVRVVWYSVIKD